MWWTGLDARATSIGGRTLREDWFARDIRYSSRSERGGLQVEKTPPECMVDAFSSSSRREAIVCLEVKADVASIVGGKTDCVTCWNEVNR